MTEGPSPSPIPQPSPFPPKRSMPKWASALGGIVGLIVVITSLSQLFGRGHDVSYGKDDIRYYHDATRANADALAKALQNEKFFGENPDGLTVLLDKKGDAITLSFVVKADKASDPETMKLFKQIAGDVAGSVPGKLTTVRLIDSDLNEKQSSGV